VIIESQFSVQVEAEPPDVLGRSDGDGEIIEGRVEGGGKGGRRGGEGPFAAPREVHEVALIRVKGHADLSKQGLCTLQGGTKYDAVLSEGVRDGEEGEVVDIRARGGGEVDGGEDGVVGQLADDRSGVKASKDGGDGGALGDSDIDQGKRGGEVVKMDGSRAV